MRLFAFLNPLRLELIIYPAEAVASARREGKRRIGLMKRMLLSTMLAGLVFGFLALPVLADDTTIEGTITVTKEKDNVKVVEITNSDGRKYMFVLDENGRRLADLEGKTVTITGDVNSSREMKVKVFKEK